MIIPSDGCPLDAGSKALVAALGERDRYTQFHSKRVADFAYQIGMACNLASDELITLNISAYFHDIGKIGIPDRILLKPLRFTVDDMQIMKSHPEKGERIVKELSLRSGDCVALAVRHHHEHFDGGGYPDGLQGEAIPFVSRIISVADSYDAMSKARPYHAARPVYEVMDIMQRESGTKLDAYVVSKLFALIESREGFLS
jgi:HD-GYP domain-containing protein (c-di-GMP phosphodiesterase class II)